MAKQMKTTYRMAEAKQSTGQCKFETNRHAVDIQIFYVKTLPCPSPETVQYHCKKTANTEHFGAAF
jgi:hypothetical protein